MIRARAFPRLRSLLLLVMASLAPPAGDDQSEPTVVLGGDLLDVERGTIRRNVAIVVDSGRIASIVDRASYRPGRSRVIDATGLTILPGLIDAHVHLSLAGTPRDNALATLRAGFTTVADLGAVNDAILRLRDSIIAGTAEGPTILAAGRWIGRSGGICEFGGIGVHGDSSAYAARVRENVGLGADLIKVCVSRWLPAAYAKPDEYEIAPEALRTVVAEAHRNGRKVVAHDLSLGGVRAAVAAGVDGLAHGALVDSATARELAQRGVFMIPTLSTLAGTPGDAPRALVESVRLAWSLGVPIVFGTDAGVLTHGANATEFQALTAAGLTSLAAIRAATVNAARALGIGQRAGVAAVGRPADLIAVAGDPLRDLGVLSHVRLVMRQGRVYRRE